MKKLTLISIIIFSLSIIGIFVINNINTRDDIVLDKTPKTTVTKNTKTTQPPIPKDIYKIKQPNIDILALEQSLTPTPTAGEFTPSTILRHNTPSDCYLAINGNVYAVSKYMPYHPAGAQIIAKYCGHEITGIFASIHSNRAWDLLSRYKIGKISTKLVDNTPKILSALSDALQSANPDASVLKVLPKQGGYIAKMTLGNRLYEVHMDSAGKILSEESETQEINWNSWDTDYDDK